MLLYELIAWLGECASNAHVHCAVASYRITRTEAGEIALLARWLDHVFLDDSLS